MSHPNWKIDTENRWRFIACIANYFSYLYVPLYLSSPSCHKFAVHLSIKPNSASIDRPKQIMSAWLDNNQ